MFWVIGGEYENSDFQHMIECTEERHGPFETYDEAYKCWANRAWLTVDNCLYRFWIEGHSKLPDKDKS